MVEQSDGLAAVTESTRHAPWTVLSALAAEYAQSIRHPVRDAVLPPQPGSVQRETQTIDVGGVEGKIDLRSDLPTQLADSENTAIPKDRVDRQAAQREAARVAAKFVSSTDVVLRFDFMKSKDTRVSTAQERRVARSTVHTSAKPRTAGRILCSAGGKLSGSGRPGDRIHSKLEGGECPHIILLAYNSAVLPAYNLHTWRIFFQVTTARTSA